MQKLGSTNQTNGFSFSAHHTSATLGHRGDKTISEEFWPFRGDELLARDANQWTIFAELLVPFASARLRLGAAQR